MEEGVAFMELFDLATIQRIQDEFAEATGVASIITTLDGTPLTRPSNFCRLCNMIRCTQAGRRNCYHSDAILGHHHPEGPIIQPCLSGGLWDAGASITVGDSHLANWLIGQVRDETQSEEKIREYARSIGADEEDAAAAFREVPAMSITRFQQISRILFTLANHIANAAYQNVQQARLIAEQKRTEEALEKKNAEMERFTYTVSHDLRSPLVTIKTFLGYLEKDLESQKAEHVSKDLNYIHGAAQKMGILLDDLLKFARIGHNQNAPVEMPLQDVVREAMILVAGGLAERGAQVEITEKPIWIFGDSARLVEVFQNLLDNAVKFLDDQEQPRIEIGAEQVGEELQITVRDNGRGIDPRYQSKVFGMFEKLDARAPGSGLGLALVRRIVELHGGKIWVESEGLGHGTTFRFTLAKTQLRQPAPTSSV
ncbi:MAG: PocR ligand-binding domain-containing protein [Verrucomicrobiae bacterium]